ncbi:hypothetical protein G6F46_009701 [Rhizopus delemar]|uniref:MT-A70-domain-containing protein n=3 Tax=Rhizopus TaxID=4842 RepID=I1CVN7_RHIO9|nr:hypothetical protein RO3G_17115 [Rhizopus delemar RA 99-880]KAG1047039.1 hypothetical protein G6F43_010496 [Rhizopus delemar]KAG1542294.1 hypothetical protein G6F51_007358 [Rhizopus arrhizus]KAG1450059.1 hypothetical protein G6F55_009870 [Rhizopus delemar]KAG1496257.1 hypothetical protein G6F54_006595 [Rhizopus delemar]|eukprot:EIE92517.1 hypothetical protein RO3G_17115 [Rhizopus delemar RA 99-880]
MSDRPKRKRRQTPKTKVSSAHYVGYVEDGESVEAIMKKFEELERIEKEFSALQMDTVEEEIATNNLTEEQLEEVFKRTSAFTVKSATIDTDTIEDLDALDLWEIEYKDGDTNEFYEPDEYHYVDESFWDEEFGEKPARKGRQQGRIIKEPRPSGTKGRGLDRESIIAKYKIMQVQVQDRNGNYFTIKKRVSNVDPSLPTYVKIPPRPISRSWAHSIQSISAEDMTHAKYFEVPDIISKDLREYGTDFSAVYMDPPFLLPGEEPTAGKISIDAFSALNVTDIIKAGFLFIWLEKEWIQKVVSITAKWGFKYVENFCWIKKDINNQIHKSQYKYFNKSKLSLLIFRKEGDIELRHQRNPDCVFDFIRPKLPDEVSEKKPPFMYSVIETLLPTANYHPEKNPRGEKLIELWAKRGQQRKGWTTIVERQS